MSENSNAVSVEKQSRGFFNAQSLLSNYYLSILSLSNLVPNVSLETVRSSTFLFAKEFGWTPEETGKIDWHVLVNLMSKLEQDYKKQEEMTREARNKSRSSSYSGGRVPGH